MAKQLPQLSKREWEAAMELVLRDDINLDSDRPFSEVTPKGNVGNAQGGAKTATEIPDIHPADGGPLSLIDPQRNDTDDAPGITDEIPADGGFQAKPAKTPETGPTMTELPADGPSDDDSPADKPNTGPVDKWNEVVGRPMSTGKPSGSFASKESAVKYDGNGWSVNPSQQVMSKTVEQWSAAPSGTNDPTGPDGNMSPKYNKYSTIDRAPKTGQNKTDENPDPDKDLALPDGTFMTISADDLVNNIDKVKTADQMNPRPDKPWYLNIKQHLMNRAADLGMQHLIPADWNLSMAMLADAEMARDIDQEMREEYLKKGWAIRNSDGSISYPIGNAKDLQNAITLARSGHGNISAAKALIRRRAKDLGIKLPADMK